MFDAADDWDDWDDANANNSASKGNSHSNYDQNNRQNDRYDRQDRRDRNERAERSDRGGSFQSRYRNDEHRDGGRNNEESVTMEIQQDKVGCVIGRGGSTIKEIQQKYNVKVNVDKNTNSNGNANVVICGSSANMNDAKSYIQELTQNNTNTRYDSNRGNNDRPRRDNVDTTSTSMEIDGSKVGCIIGRGGATIRELENKFNVKIDIQRNGGQATVVIRGKNGSDAVNEINSLVGDRMEQDDQPMTRNDAPREPANDDFVPIDWQAAARESEEENKKKWAKLPKLKKKFYKEHADVTNMSAERAAYIREQNNNTSVSRLFLDEPVDEASIPNPVETFEQCFSDYPDLLDEIRKQRFETPSPIQAQAWPVLLRGEDLIGIAQTGTGKTLAFLLPAMIHTEYQSVPRSERGGPNVLVLAPTRELALQIQKEVEKYQFRGMKAVCVYGGGDRAAQIRLIGQGVEILIATPGRLNDLVQANVIDVFTITYLVLDEADRMLDMGFEPQIRKVLLDIRPDRQTIMTSATWPEGVRRLAERYMKNPIQVCVGSLDLAAVHSVEQIISIIDENEKFDKIMDFVGNMDDEEKVIIFCGKKSRADDLSSEISLKGIAVQCIHGDREQIDREQALADIKAGVVKILIATDVASRGIDIGDITHVINYDFPRNIEEYVHRVGRTGRAGKTGTSISLFTRSDWGSAGDLINILEEANQEVPEELRNMKSRFDAKKERENRERASCGGGGRRGGGGGRGRRY